MWKQPAKFKVGTTKGDSPSLSFSPRRIECGKGRDGFQEKCLENVP